MRPWRSLEQPGISDRDVGRAGNSPKFAPDDLFRQNGRDMYNKLPAISIAAILLRMVGPPHSSMHHSTAY